MCKRFIHLLSAVIIVAFLTNCSKEEPVTFEAKIDMTINSFSFAKGDEMKISKVVVSNVTITQGEEVQPVGSDKVERVEYFIGNRKLGEEVNAPYTFNYNIDNLKTGTHELRVDVVFKDVPKIKRARVWATYELTITN